MERQAGLFYVAEFLLSLLGATAENLAHPASGLFHHMSESVAPIQRFLTDNRVLLERLYGKNLKLALGAI
jgi:hypothetical protein